LGNKNAILSILAVFSLVLVLSLSACSTARSITNSTPKPGTGILQPSATIDLETPTGKAAESLPIQDLSMYVNDDPSTVDNSKLPVTRTEDLHVTGAAPDVKIADYRLTVDGLVDRPLSLTLDEVKSYPAETQLVLLICQGVFVDNAVWAGVPVRALLAEAGVKPGAKMVYIYSVDGYVETLSLNKFESDDIFLAYSVNGDVLPKAHGFPLRLVAKGIHGDIWVKWVGHIEIK
jgi:DMSO/TMAO reductase YedYZ molybdopterin-dependent catalytic subunit